MKIPHTLALAGLFILTSHVSADTFYVDDDAPPGGNGTSWSQAFRFLSDALVAAESEGGSNTIRVAGGTYLPDRSNANPSGTGNRAATFDVPGATTIRGGYAGVGASNPNERNIEKYQTILSGDLARDGSEDDTKDENSIHVITIIEQSSVVTLNGLVVSGGYANDENDHRGGGLLIEDTDVVLERVEVRDNACRGSDRPRGAGLFAVRSTLTIRESVFADNDIYGGGLGSGASCGGAGLAVQVTNLTLDSCVVEHNVIHSGGGELHGGGLWAASQSNVIAVDCQFIHNHGFSDVGRCRGGAIYLTSTDAEFVNTIFQFNSLHATFADINGWSYGGGIFQESGALFMERCSFLRNSVYGDKSGFGGAAFLRGNVTAINCEFVNNSAASDPKKKEDNGSGGLALAGVSSTFINCTFARNRPSGVSRGNQLTLRNCILWSNGATGELREQIEGVTSTQDIAWSCVQGFAGDWSGPGIIADNPLFLDLESNNVRLTHGSPCIDAADNSSIDSNVTIDLRGAVRRYDDPNAPDSGQGPGPIVDMGAYEYFADCNNNLQPDNVDIAFFAVELDSGNLSPFGFDAPRNATFDTPVALSNVTIHVEASGDLNGTGEYISVALNGSPLGDIFVTGASDCAIPPNKQTLVLAADDFNALAGDVAAITLQPSASVSSGACDDNSYVRVQLQYESSVAVDENMDGVPDVCVMMGDLNADGVVNVSDLFALLAAFGPCDAPCPPSCTGDITGPAGTVDCRVDVYDLFALLSNWSG